MSETVLEYQHVQKSFHGVQVLKDINFKIGKGEVLGLVGENGAGKSTLMNILGGVFPYEGGKIYFEGREYVPSAPKEATEAGIVFIHQELNLFTNLSISENIYISNFPKRSFFGVSSIKKKQLREKTANLLEMVGLKVSPDTIVENLSPGERQLVEIAKALSVDAKVIIFDEPTTSLTEPEKERLFDIIIRLKSSNKSIIYISHALQDVFRMCDNIVILRDGKVVGTGASNAMTEDYLVTLMVGREMEQLFPKKNNHTGEPILEVKGVSEPGIVEDINFQLRRGEVLGISGLMGSGRTELARIIFGLDAFEKGEIHINGEVLTEMTPISSIQKGFAFLTENRKEEGLLMDKSILENLALVSLDQFTKGPLKKIRKQDMYDSMAVIYDQLKISTVNTEKQLVQNLSGGNQQKVVIGKWLYHNPSIFIMDEPTRGIDVGAKYEVYKVINQLAEDGSAILVISSEIEELIGICDRILVMANGEINGEFTKAEFDREKIIKRAFGGDQS